MKDWSADLAITRYKLSSPSNIAWDFVFCKNFLLEFSFTWGLKNSGNSSSPYVFLYSEITCRQGRAWITIFNQKKRKEKKIKTYISFTWWDQIAGRGTSPSNLHNIVRPIFFVSHLAWIQKTWPKEMLLLFYLLYLLRGVALTDWL